jgi:hypothetical protein
MAKHTGITQRSSEDGFAHAFEVDEQHMSAYSCLGRRSALHHRGFYAQAADGTPSNRWLEVWWTTHHQTGAVTDIFEDTRGLNRP